MIPFQYAGDPEFYLMALCRARFLAFERKPGPRRPEDDKDDEDFSVYRPYILTVVGKRRTEFYRLSDKLRMRLRSEQAQHRLPPEAP